MGLVRIIGVSDDGAEGLSRKALAWIEEADLLLGGQRLLDLFTSVCGAKFPIKANVAEVVRQIESADPSQRNIVVLASGDPNFYGIARRLVEALGAERVEIVPNISAVQLAFARIKESWDDAKLYSVHGRDLTDLVEIVRANPKIAILTDNVNSPSAIASVLLSAGLADRSAYVCENLGSARERIVKTTLASLPGQEFSPLNVLVLIDKNVAADVSVQQGRGGDPALSASTANDGTPISSRPWTLGISDDEFFQRKPLRGLITKAEVRVISLSKLVLRENSVVWDVGAGSGSVSVEAALLAIHGHVYAVERYNEDVEIILKNVAKFGLRNISVVQGTAPGALAQLPNPDAVFIGGSGGQLREIVATVAARMSAGGHIVINLTTLENLPTGLAALREIGFAVEVTQVAVARGKAVGDLTRLQPLDPVFILSGCK